MVLNVFNHIKQHPDFCAALGIRLRTASQQISCKSIKTSTTHTYGEFEKHCIYSNNDFFSGIISPSRALAPLAARCPPQLRMGSSSSAASSAWGPSGMKFARSNTHGQPLQDYVGV